ncbi:hypothetical protein [Spirillospora sp. CA-294931]|uniref:hypothetical protein n=1 Tax=Spirillospora sp. CA-294931 TaxID=3240042 RepID=UPI003D915048
MPSNRHLMRLGTASTAVSAGALALVFLGAPAANAQAAAAPKPCKKGTDPASTIDNWKCQFDNWRESLNPKKPATQKPPAKKPPAKNTGGGEAKPAKPAKGKVPSGKSGGSAPRVSVPSGSLAPQTAPEGLRPYTPDTGAAPRLPGVLPTPEIAADPSAYLPPAGDGTGVRPQTRIMSPVAASEPSGGQTTTLWVAAAAGAAGAVGALNLSVAGRSLRRSRP